MSNDDKAEGEGFVIKDNRSSQLSEEEAETHDTQESTETTGQKPIINTNNLFNLISQHL